MKIPKHILKREQAVSGEMQGQERSTMVNCEGYAHQLVNEYTDKIHCKSLTFGVQSEPSAGDLVFFPCASFDAFV